jgi:hypothetical protein
MEKKITELNELLELAANDLLLAVDNPGDPTKETKYIKASTLLDFINGPNINPNNYDTTINLFDLITKSSNGVTFTSDIDNKVSFNSNFPSGTIKNMQINVNGQEKALISFYSIYLNNAITIVIEGIVYNTTFIDGVKNL